LWKSKDPNFNLWKRTAKRPPPLRTTITRLVRCNKRVCRPPGSAAGFHSPSVRYGMPSRQFAQVCSVLFSKRYYRGGLQSRKNQPDSLLRINTRISSTPRMNPDKSRLCREFYFFVPFEPQSFFHELENPIPPPKFFHRSPRSTGTPRKKLFTRELSWLLRRGACVAQEFDVGNNIGADDRERLAVRGELEIASLIGRKVRQPMTRRAIQRLRPNVANSVYDGVISHGLAVRSDGNRPGCVNTGITSIAGGKECRRSAAPLSLGSSRPERVAFGVRPILRSPEFWV
jgi:hypothetical protein